MATHKEINHDSGGAVADHYTLSVIDTDSRGSITVGSALNGSTEGLQIVMSGGFVSARFREGMSALPGNTLRLRVYFDPNSVSVSTGGSDIRVDIRDNTLGFSLGGLRFSFHSSGDTYRVLGRVTDDSTNDQATSEYALTDEPHCVEIAVDRAASTSSNDGTFTLYVDGVARETVSSLDLFDNWPNINQIDVFCSSTGTGDSGNAYLDEILVDDSSGSDLCAAVNHFRFLGFDADNGTLLVTGLKNAGTLQLFEYTDLASLTESGTTSFGSATDTELDNLTRGIFPVVRPEGDGVWYLFGRDGNNVQAQYNDDNGTLGWTDIGPGTATWGTAKYAVALMPAPTAPDDVIIAFDDNDIYRARYGTATWVKMGDADSGLRTAVRHPVRFNELLAGGTAAGTVWYSHNFGVSFTSVGGTALGTINAFEVSL